MNTLEQVKLNEDVNSRVINAATLLEADLCVGELEFYENPDDDPEKQIGTLRERVQSVSCFRGDEMLDDIHAALTVRNAIAHLSDDAQPTHADKMLAATTLIDAIEKWRASGGDDADNWALESQGIDTTKNDSGTTNASTDMTTVIMLGVLWLVVSAGGFAFAVSQGDSDNMRTAILFSVGMLVLMPVIWLINSAEDFLDTPEKQEERERKKTRDRDELDGAIVRAAALLEVELRNSGNDRGAEQTLGELVQQCAAFKNVEDDDNYLRDLNFALGIRNSICHPVWEMTSTSERRRALQYIEQARRDANSSRTG